MNTERFWQTKSLAEMTSAEFESLCDGCGKCCLHKLEDEDTGEVFYTNVACRFLDHGSCRCQTYSTRQQAVPECIVLTPDSVRDTSWLPETCAYRLIDASLPLHDWHPLISGDTSSVHKVGMSVAGRVLHEHDVNPDDMEDHVVYWV